MGDVQINTSLNPITLVVPNNSTHTRFPRVSLRRTIRVQFLPSEGRGLPWNRYNGRWVADFDFRQLRRGQSSHKAKEKVMFQGILGDDNWQTSNSPSHCPGSEAEELWHYFYKKGNDLEHSSPLWFKKVCSRKDFENTFLKEVFEFRGKLTSTAKPNVSHK
ncbi:hypothetical protein GOBAR_DD05293 [Gossypium barbadense]|nr:hypothetical protein GOBAR_DD05293 [Gossypium barbadense]